MSEKTFKMNNLKWKLLWVSNSPHLSTGYGVQTNQICNYLAGQHRISKNKTPFNVNILGLQQTHSPMTMGNINILPRFHGDEWAKESMPYWAKQIKPDIITTMMDVWVTDVLEKIGKKYTYIPYVPIDSEVIPPRISKPLSVAEEIVAFSDFGVSELEKAGFHDNITKIPHVTDNKIFRPVKKTNKYSKEKFGIEDKFVYLFVGTNIGRRKRIPRLMWAFKQLKKEVKDVILWLHTDPHNKRGGNLRQIADMIGLEEGTDIIFTPGYRIGTPVPNTHLNELYNMADVFVSATEGEGFGLTHIESMATGTPNIMTDFSTAEEFIGDNERGFRVDLATKWVTPIGHKRALVDVDKMTEKMRILYDDENKLNKMSKNALEFSKNYSPENILPQWKNLYLKICQNNRGVVDL